MHPRPAQSLNLLLVEGILEQLVITHVFMTAPGRPIDAAHGDGAGEDVFCELACHGSRGGFFDFFRLRSRRVFRKVRISFRETKYLGSVHHSCTALKLKKKRDIVRGSKRKTDADASIRRHAVNGHSPMAASA